MSVITFSSQLFFQPSTPYLPPLTLSSPELRLPFFSPQTQSISIQSCISSFLCGVESGDSREPSRGRRAPLYQSVLSATLASERYRASFSPLLLWLPVRRRNHGSLTDGEQRALLQLPKEPQVTTPLGPRHKLV